MSGRGRSWFVPIPILLTEPTNENGSTSDYKYLSLWLRCCYWSPSESPRVWTAVLRKPAKISRGLSWSTLPPESRAKFWNLQSSWLLLFSSDCAQCKFLTCGSLLPLQWDSRNNNTLLCLMHDKAQKIKWNNGCDASDIIALQLSAFVTDFIIFQRS